MDESKISVYRGGVETGGMEIPVKAVGESKHAAWRGRSILGKPGSNYLATLPRVTATSNILFNRNPRIIDLCGGMNESSDPHMATYIGIEIQMIIPTLGQFDTYNESGILDPSRWCMPTHQLPRERREEKT